MMRLFVVLAAVLGVACGGGSPSNTLGGKGDGSLRKNPPDGKVGATDTGYVSNSARCLVAVRVNTCCPVPVAAPRDRVLEDPCLVPWPAEEIPEGCEPTGCPSTCIPVEPVSRLAEPDPEGGCRFANECNQDSDCATGFDRRRCCSCAAAVPKALITADPCVVRVDSDLASPAACRARCPDDCPGCPPFWVTPRCMEAVLALHRNRCVGN
jgi:hypothetical protein